MEDVIGLHRHRVDRIEGKLGNDKEVGEGRRRVCRTRHVRKAAEKAIGPITEMRSCSKVKEPSLIRAEISVVKKETPF